MALFFLKRLLLQACQCNPVVKGYLGSNLKLRYNNRLHEISERVREYANIRVVGLRPLALEWTKQQPDEANGNKNNDNNFEEKQQGSHNDFGGEQS